MFIGLLYFWYMSVSAMWLLRAKRSGVLLDVPIFTPWSYISIDIPIAVGA